MVRKKLKNNIKVVTFNNNNFDSIARAEKKKIMLENKGYNLVSTSQVGFDRWVMKYKKRSKLRKVM